MKHPYIDGITSMTAHKLRKSALISTFALALISAASMPAQAGSNSWNGQVGGPTLYQTNYWYNSSYINPPGSTPSTAKISGLSWNLSLSYTPSGVQYKICIISSPSYCGYTASASGYDSTYFAGQPANKSIQFLFNVSQSTTHTLSPYVYGGTDQVTVSYNY